MGVVEVLSDKRMRLNSAICIYLRHVQVVHKIDELLITRRGKVSPCLLLQRFLQYTYS